MSQEQPTKMDRLQQLFELQKTLMDRMSVPYPGGGANPFIEYDPALTYTWVQKMCRALSHEAHELEDWTPWKGWSKQLGNKVQIEHCSEEHLKEMRMEVIDALHFIMELGLILGMDADQVYEMYLEKNGINHARQDQGNY